MNIMSVASDLLVILLRVILTGENFSGIYRPDAVQILIVTRSYDALS
jgi:hypothetical protein